MDILYILGGGSKRDNIELRWSLRSIEKFGANIGRIAVAGVIPDWVSDEVIRIPVEQKSPLYAKNNFHNVMEAVRSGELDDKFLLSADDHFYVKPVDFDDFPLFVAGFLPDRMDYMPNNEYFFGLYYSRKLLERAGLPFYNCSLHNNIPVDSTSFEHQDDLLWYCDNPTHRMNPWAIFGNLYLSVNPEAKICVRDDIKINEPMPSRKAITNRIGKAHMFSIGDAAFSGGALEDYMNELFPAKSRYEK